MIIQADSLQPFPLADSSVQCVVTSPPYWGLRDYQVDGQLGLEATPDEYVANMVAVFREVRRVLRPDGVLWLNLGDSYASGKGTCFNPGGGEFSLGKGRKEVGVHPLDRGNKSTLAVSGLKPKDLCGIPWLVAKALQSSYYSGRIKSERDRIYLAATLDAEGTICGYTHQRKDSGDIRRGVHVAITNSNVLMLDECYRIWPTSRKEHNPHGKGHLGGLDVFRWIAHGVEIKQQLMAELYPYLVCKRKQALLAWNFFEISKQARGRNKGKEGDSNREKSAWIVHALSKLNHLDAVDIPDWIKEPPSQYEPGWWLRSDCIWAKPNPMPESVTDRPTRSHEYVFLLTKSAKYYWDAEAVKESGSTNSHGGGILGEHRYMHKSGRRDSGLDIGKPAGNDGRNLRSVWTLPTQPTKEAHFATYPQSLVERCILAGTSEHGACAACGAPWERIVEKGLTAHDGETDSGYQQGSTANRLALLRQAARARGGEYANGSKTLGWQPTCKCGCREVRPCVVFDPFVGSGTTVLVAERLGRTGIGLELNPEYCKMARDRCWQVKNQLQLGAATADTE